MAESPAESKQKTWILPVAVVCIVAVAAVVGALLAVIYPKFVFSLLAGSSTFTVGGSIYQIVYVDLSLVTDVLYLLGGGVVIFGAFMVVIRFLQQKLHEPYQPTLSTRQLSGYLTLSLNFFIGAEIVRTVVVGTSEIELLLLVIASRGLFSLILFFERRWHGETE